MNLYLISLFKNARDSIERLSNRQTFTIYHFFYSIWSLDHIILQQEFSQCQFNFQKSKSLSNTAFFGIFIYFEGKIIISFSNCKYLSNKRFYFLVHSQRTKMQLDFSCTLEHVSMDRMFQGLLDPNTLDCNELTIHQLQWSFPHWTEHHSFWLVQCSVYSPHLRKEDVYFVISVIKLKIDKFADIIYLLPIGNIRSTSLMNKSK